MYDPNHKFDYEPVDIQMDLTYQENQLKSLIGKSKSYMIHISYNRQWINGDSINYNISGSTWRNIDKKEQEFQNKKKRMLKVFRKKFKIEEGTWKLESEMRNTYPH